MPKNKGYKHKNKMKKKRTISAKGMTSKNSDYLNLPSSGSEKKSMKIDTRKMTSKNSDYLNLPNR
jgi:hypothetical protein